MRTLLLASVLLLFSAIACRAVYPTPTPSPTPLPRPPAAQPTVAPTPTFTPTLAPTPTPAGVVVRVSSHPQFGPILTDPQGRTLYLFTRDEPNKTNCTGTCLQAWPPLLTQAPPVAGEGVHSNLLGTIQRPEGSTRVTYNGWPLYYFASDQSPGEAKGQGVRGVWFVVSPAGAPVGASSPPTPAPTAQPTPSPTPIGQVREVRLSLRFPTFTPNRVRVQVGEAVRFVLVGESGSHTFTFESPDARVDLPVRGGQTVTTDTLVFTQPGRIRFWCRPHESYGMVGEIEVVPAGQSMPPPSMEPTPTTTPERDYTY
ncbi:Plastocyanin [bacterium HR23]|nr:Plastocyanin [bacterium HR23]